MERVIMSFARDFRGEITAPAPYATIIRDRGEFSHFLSDPTLFFDGRFAFFEKYEGENFFEKSSLIALILRGEHELIKVKDEGDAFEVVLKHVKGEEHTLYFLPVERDENKTQVKLSL